MTVYNVLMESFYYDGGDFVIVDVTTDVKTFSSFDKAKDCLERAIKEEIADDKYTEDMLTRDGDDYAVFCDCVGDGSSRTLYRITIYESEVLNG